MLLTADLISLRWICIIHGDCTPDIWVWGDPGAMKRTPRGAEALCHPSQMAIDGPAEPPVKGGVHLRPRSY